jgi:hypothetical protein
MYKKCKFFIRSSKSVFCYVGEVPPQSKELVFRKAAAGQSIVESYNFKGSDPIKMRGAEKLANVRRLYLAMANHRKLRNKYFASSLFLR